MKLVSPLLRRARLPDYGVASHAGRAHAMQGALPKHEAGPPLVADVSSQDQQILHSQVAECNLREDHHVSKT